MAKITITIEDSEDKKGRVMVKINGDYNDHVQMLKDGLLTNAQMVALTAVDSMNELHEETEALGRTLREHFSEIHQHIHEEKEV